MKYYSIKKQAIVSTIGSTIYNASQWAMSIVLVRLGGYEDAGVYSLAMTVSNIFSSLANYNLRSVHITNRDSQYNDKDFRLARYVTSAAALCLGCSYLLLTESNSKQENKAIFIFLLFSLLNVLSDTIMGSMQKMNHLEINGYSYIIKGLVLFLYFILTYIYTKSLIISLIAILIGEIAIIILYDLQRYKQICKIETVRSEGGKYKCLMLLKTCFPLMLSQLLPFIITAYPRFVIKNKLGIEKLGVFSTVFTPTVIIMVAVPTIINAFLPNFADLWKNKEKKKFIKLSIMGYGYLMFLGIISLLVALLFAKPVMKILFGDSIISYTYLLYPAIIATMLNAATCYGNGLLIVMNDNKSVLFGSLAALVIVILLSMKIINNLGIIGAAIILIIGYTVQNIVLVHSIIMRVYKQN